LSSRSLESEPESVAADTELLSTVVSADLDEDRVVEQSAPGDRPAAEAADEGGSILAALEKEISESEACEEEAAPVAANMPACECALPDELLQLINQRLRIWSEILAIDERRQEMAGSPIREIRDELARQTREMQRAPALEMLVKTVEDLKKKLANPVLPSLASKEPPPLKPGEPTYEETYRKALEMGLTQSKLLLLRAHLDSKVPAAALPAAQGEPVLEMCRAIGIEIEPLMGWTYYALGLFQKMAECRRAEDAHAAKVAAARAQSESEGLMSRLMNACLGEEQQVAPPDPAIRRTRQAVETELRIIDPLLSEMFWKLYGDVAWALASGKTNEQQTPYARALLRYGMLAVHPGLISPEVKDFILNDCATDVYSLVNTPDALHVLYADEYITAIHQRLVTVSPDEDLELNNRGSEEWKADRVWRQAAAYAARTTLYQNRLVEMQRRIDELTELCEKQKNEYAALRGASGSQASALADKLVANRADLARLKQAVERLNNKFIPDLQAKSKDAEEKLAKALEVFTPEMVVRREAVFVRRLARLAAQLKEPYLPFVLRETFVPGRSDHFSRASVKEAVTRIEQADHRIFHEVVIGNKRPDRQVTVRMSPVFLLLPGKGQMGFSLCPRKWDDSGRLVLPLVFQRQNGLESLLIDILSDFRWDCSKEEAGQEWITADALCAAYAAVRWNYRRFTEKAQKTMGLDRKQKDRENWRVHYRLFITSAHDRGRYLFNKCFDVYKNVVLRYIGLPPGVEPLRRD